MLFSSDSADWHLPGLSDRRDPNMSTKRILKNTALAIAFAVMVAACSSSADASDSATPSGEIVMEAATSAGQDPFTPSVQVTEYADEAVAAVREDHPVAVSSPEELEESVDAGATVIVEVRGDRPGLYGGSGDQSACDTQGLVGFLTADSAKGSAWAYTPDRTGPLPCG